MDDWATMLAEANAGDGRAYAGFLRAITPVLRGIVRAKRFIRGCVHDCAQLLTIDSHAVETLLEIARNKPLKTSQQWSANGGD